MASQSASTEQTELVGVACDCSYKKPKDSDERKLVQVGDLVLDRKSGSLWVVGENKAKPTALRKRIKLFKWHEGAIRFDRVKYAKSGSIIFVFFDEKLSGMTLQNREFSSRLEQELGEPTSDPGKAFKRMPEIGSQKLDLSERLISIQDKPTFPNTPLMTISQVREMMPLTKVSYTYLDLSSNDLQDSDFPEMSRFVSDYAAQECIVNLSWNALTDRSAQDLLDLASRVTLFVMIGNPITVREDSDFFKHFYHQMLDKVIWIQFPEKDFWHRVVAEAKRTQVKELHDRYFDVN